MRIYRIKFVVQLDQQILIPIEIGRFRLSIPNLSGVRRVVYATGP